MMMMMMMTMTTMTTAVIVAIAIVVVVVPPGGAVQNACYLNNGYCRYQVNIVSECDSDAAAETRSEQQDGYYGGPNAIEKYLLQAKSEHSERLAALEGKLNKYLKYSEPAKSKSKSLVKASEFTATSAAANEVLSKVRKRKRSHGGSNGFRKDPARKENNLLNRIHKEFTILRDQLDEARQKLRETEESLRGASAKLNESEAENRKLSHQLRHTEGKLEEEQANGYRYRKSLQERESRLNETKAKLKSTQAELRRLRLENWKLKAENDDYKALLEQCLAEKETLRKALEQALIKYHELNLKHENITTQLNETQAELVTCYRGKTTQFCGFEDPAICGFEKLPGSDDLEWIRWHEATPSAYTGPSNDHTCDNSRGYYVYVEATKRAEGDTAKLISPRYYGYGEQCIEFYYHMYGYHVGILKVYTVVPGQDAVPMWRAFGNQGDVWSMARIPVPEKEANKGYQVVFEVTIGFGNEADIAVDDFRIFDGSCYDVTSVSKEDNNITTTQAKASDRVKTD